MSTKKLLLVLPLVSLASHLCCQTSTVAHQGSFDYSSPQGYGTVVTHALAHPSGNYCVVGYTAEGQGKYFVALRSRYGSPVWVYQLSPAMTAVSDLKIRSDGTIYVLGYKETVSKDTVLIAVSPQGNEIYNMTSNLTPAGNVNDEGTKLALYESGVYIAGVARRKGPGSGRHGFFISKFNDKGRLFTAWTKHSYWSSDANYDGRILVRALGLGQNGDVTLAGRITVHPNTNENKAYTWRFSTDGQQLVEGLVDLGPNTNIAVAKIMPDGSPTFAGTVPDGGNNKRFVANIGLSGGLNWYVTGAPEGSKTFGQAIDIDPLGNVYVGGSRHTNDVTVGTLEKFNSLGVPLWSKDVADPVSNVLVDPILEVYTSGITSQSQLRVAKFSSTGVLRLMQLLNIPSNNLLLGPSHALVTHPASGDVGVLSTVYTADPEYYRGSSFTVRQAPVPIADGYIMSKNTTLSNRVVVTNDRFASGASASITIPPSVGAITFGANGLFSYTPPIGFTGIVTFTYKLSKPGVTANTAKVTIDVRP